MTIQSVFFDLGGVMLRTEYQAPREHLAERLGLSYEELVGLVFDSESSRRASVGEIQPQEHWEAVARRLGIAREEIPALREEFFGGDVLDRELLRLIRSLRPARKTGLISNAWLDGRDYALRNGFADAFDALIFSAEAGLVKPDPAIFQLALKALDTVPERAVMVDDFAENVEAARAVGMHGILFRNPEAALSELRGLLGLP
ncbi:MAG TPA: HAD family phosphatase, partial [Anaerolineales bacterium]|nr:HAD family phosphatase [Anaerolineales bacterium]